MTDTDLNRLVAEARKTDARTALDRLADAFVEDIMSMSDEEILEEMREDGRDPEQVAIEGRRIFERALEQVRKMEEPGRELDFRVAQALGYTIYKVDYGSRRSEWAVVNTWDEWNERPYIDDRARGYGKITLPRFSQPKNIADRAALIECIVWLANQDTPIRRDSENVWDLNALALAVCRAVVA